MRIHPQIHACIGAAVGNLQSGIINLSFFYMEKGESARLKHQLLQREDAGLHGEGGFFRLDVSLTYTEDRLPKFEIRKIFTVE